MSGTFGLDLQPSRSAVVLREGSGAAAFTSVVGDGRRRLIHHSAGAHNSSELAGGILRSAADVAAVLATAAAAPEDAPLLAGLYDRLTAYLGRVAPTPTNGYGLAVVVPPGRSAAQTRSACEAAGFPEVSTIDAAEALLACWLATTDIPGNDWVGRVTVVACGEHVTTIDAYRVERGLGPGGPFSRFGALAKARRILDRGSAPWTARLAGQVVERCPEGLPAQLLPALVDGVDEAATSLRSAGPGGVVEWAGPGASRMFSPLRVAANDPTDQAAAEYRSALAHELADLRRLVGDAGAPSRSSRASVPFDLVLVGGPGALWPHPESAAAAASVGPVWQSADPAMDLAVGAAWRRSIGAAATVPIALQQPSPGPAPAAAPATTTTTTTTTTTAPTTVAATTRTLAPWPGEPGADPERPPWERSEDIDPMEMR